MSVNYSRCMPAALAAIALLAVWATELPANDGAYARLTDYDLRWTQPPVPPPELDEPTAEALQSSDAAGDVSAASYSGSSVDQAVCQACGPAPFWGSAEYLLWWTKERQLPPLISTGPVGSDGVLGQPGVSVLFGDGGVSDGVRSGGRLRIGHWLGDDQRWGIVGAFMGLESDTVSWVDAPAGTPVLARPFFNVTLGIEDSLLVNNPGQVAGTMTASTQNDVLGAEIYARTALYCASGYRVDLIGGYQFNRIDDSLRLTSSSTATDPNGVLPLGTVIDVDDVFDTRNRFHGGSLGLLAEIADGPLKLEMLAKLGFGNMNQVVTIDGSTVVTVPAAAPITTAGGLLAQPTNIGFYERDVFSIMPEAGVTLSYCISEGVLFSFGYTLMYWNHVALAGDQVDRVVNTTQLGGGALVGPARPRFTGIDNGFWVQGINFGLTWEY